MYQKLILFQFMEWNFFKINKFWGQISINKISINKNSKIMKLITCDSSQVVHSSYKKKWDILTLHKKFFSPIFVIQIKIGLNIICSRWSYTWGLNPFCMTTCLHFTL